MNQRHDDQSGRGDRERGQQHERGAYRSQESTRDFYPGNYGFQETRQGTYSGQGQYEQDNGRDPYTSGQDRYERGYGGVGSDYRFGSQRPRRRIHLFGAENLYSPVPFPPESEPRYFGTGAPGWGGTGFTGGAHGYSEDTFEADTARLYEHGTRDDDYRDYDTGDHGARVGQGRQYGPGYGGSGAAQGTGMARGERRRYPRGPKGYRRSDERLLEDVSERLMLADDIDSSDVTVDVVDAVVVLDGTVPDRSMKYAIEDLVDSCLGVQDIDNRIRVDGSSSQSSGGRLEQAGASQSGTRAEGGARAGASGRSDERSEASGRQGDGGATGGRSAGNGGAAGRSGQGSASTSGSSSGTSSVGGSSSSASAAGSTGTSGTSGTSGTGASGSGGSASGSGTTPGKSGRKE